MDTLRRGDSGARVIDLQRLLKIKVDGDFGPVTEEAVRAFQRSEHLTVDGEVGPETWHALQPDAVDDVITRITNMAGSHPIARFNWRGRGMAPPGYTKGVAVSFYNALMMLRAGKAPYVAMARAIGGNKLDALRWYSSQFNALGMQNNTDGPDTLRHLFVLLLGLGMRESSGRYCEGRDISATNTSSSSAEAGAWQMSWDAHAGVPLLAQLMSEYGGDGLLSIYREGVHASASSLRNWGSGTGFEFQRMSKAKPDFAAHATALGLRSLRTHWGPVNRREVQVRPEADDMLRKVQIISAPTTDNIA